MADTNDMYCTRTDCEKLLSAEGVALRIDDDGTSIDDAIKEATAHVRTLLALVYTPAGLGKVPIVTYIVRFMACCNLFYRRGDTIPEGWEKKLAKYEKLIEKIADGTFKLAELPQAPGGVGVSNQEVDLELYPQLGVSKPRSTNIRNPAARRYNQGAQRYWPR